MATPLIIAIPADTTPTQWAEIHKALSDHRAAYDGKVDTAASFAPAATAGPSRDERQLAVMPDVLPSLTSPTPSLLETLTAPSSPAPVAPVPEPVVQLPVGDPNWLQNYVAQHGTFPEATDDNWQHILADTLVKAAVSGTPHDEAYKMLRKQAGTGKARFVKAHKHGNGNGSTQPATSLMATLGQAVQAPVAAPAAAAPITPAQIVQYSAQLSDEKRRAIWSWGCEPGVTKITPQNQAIIAAWINGDVDPETKVAVTLDKATSLMTDKAAQKLRSMATS